MDSEDSKGIERGHGFRQRRSAVQDELELLAPPPSVLDDVVRAARRYDELGAEGRQLHFDLERGQLRVELRDLEGNVLRRISPAEALAVACGGTP